MLPGIQHRPLPDLDHVEIDLDQAKHRHRPLDLRPRRQRRSIARPRGREPFEKVRLARRQIEDAVQLQEPLDPVVDASHSGALASLGDTATWSGVMSGVEASPSSGSGSSVLGNSAVTVSGLAAGVEVSVDVAFTNILNEDTGAGIIDMVWRGLPLQCRQFGTDDVLFNDGAGYFRDESFGAAAPGSIYGRLYGPGHEEVGGLFQRDGIAGAFAGKRDR